MTGNDAMKAIEDDFEPLKGVLPKDKLEGRAEAILAERDAKLAAVTQARKALRKAS